MYDKIKFFIPRTSSTEEIARHLERVCNIIDTTTGECTLTSGTIGGVKVMMYPNGVAIIGSLPKYYNKSNVFTLDRVKTDEALGMLSDALHVDLATAFVTGLEFGTQFPMKKPTGIYLRRFGDVPRLKRERVGDGSIYYKSIGKRQGKTLCFYDKAVEAQAKGIQTPGLLAGMPLLRYEMRFNGHLASQFKVNEVLGRTLTDETFYRNMVKLWQHQYFAIPKTKQTKCSVMDNIKTANDAVNIFFARLINQTGQDEIGDFVNELKQNGTFQDAKYYTRVKKRLQEIAATISEDCASDDIRELDDAIRNAGAYI